MSGIMLTINRRIQSNKGSAMVEFALVLPILMMLFSGFLDLGYMMHQSLVLQNIARDAARSTSLNQLTAPDTNIDEAVKTKALNGIPNKDEWDIGITFSPSSSGVRKANTQVTVMVKCNIVSLTGVLQPFVDKKDVLKATAVTRVEP